MKLQVKGVFKVTGVFESTSYYLSNGVTFVVFDTAIEKGNFVYADGTTYMKKGTTKPLLQIKTSKVLSEKEVEKMKETSIKENEASKEQKKETRKFTKVDKKAKQEEEFPW